MPVPNMVVGFGAALLVVAIAGLLTLRAARDFANSSRLVVHTQVVLETLAALQVGYAEMVAAVRAYVITGEERYNLERQDAAVDMHAALDTLRIMTADNALRQRDLEALRVELDHREATLMRALAVRAEGGVPAVLALAGDPDVNATTQRVSDLLDQIRREERNLLARRSQLDDDRIVNLRRTLFAFFACTVVILGVLFMRALDSYKRREAGRRELQLRSLELESANKELESFSYSVSHDLRAPLRAVDGYAALLQEDFAASLDDEGRRFLAAIREGARSMGVLIQDLLAFSRLGRLPIEPIETDTRILVNSAWERIQQGHKDLRATLQVGDLPPSFGDPRLLLQIWANLLDNAVKYSDKSAQPHIEVRGELKGDEAVFSVSDNGVGFDMRYYDKLFKVFQRLHSQAEYAGTGVGLAIIARIAARHGGRAWAESIPGQGAVFYFALPNHATHPDAVAEAV
jgi:signal transduction histidine kinase